MIEAIQKNRNELRELLASLKKDPPKIRCNNCESLFLDEDDLKTIESESHEGEHQEFFKGCPKCLTDEYLMDL